MLPIFFLNVSMQTLHTSSVWGAFWGLLEVFWSLLEASWRPLGASLRPFGGLLEASWRLFEAFWRPLGASWRSLEGSCVVLEALGGFGGVLEASETIWMRFGGLLEASWRLLEASWRPLGASEGVQEPRLKQLNVIRITFCRFSKNTTKTNEILLFLLLLRPRFAYIFFKLVELERAPKSFKALECFRMRLRCASLRRRMRSGASSSEGPPPPPPPPGGGGWNPQAGRTPQWRGKGRLNAKA